MDRCPQDPFRVGLALMAEVNAAAQRPVVQPSVHVRVVITWIAIFPLVAMASLAIAPVAQEWNPILRALVVSTLVVPVAVYLVVPRLLRLYVRLRKARSGKTLATNRVIHEAPK